MDRLCLVISGLVAAGTMLTGCDAANEQMAYVRQQRQACMAAGGYFIDNKTGSPDNYTCRSLHGPQPTAAINAPPPSPTNCRSEATNVKRADGSEETRSTQVCTSSP
jgi:hypothetical protein